MNIDETGIKDVRRLHSDIFERTVTRPLGFVTLMVGLHSITEESLDEWEFRVVFWQALFGPMIAAITVGRGDITVNPKRVDREMLRRRIGLTTTAPMMSRGEFVLTASQHFSEWRDRMSSKLPGTTEKEERLPVIPPPPGPSRPN